MRPFFSVARSDTQAVVSSPDSTVYRNPLRFRHELNDDDDDEEAPEARRCVGGNCPRSGTTVQSDAQRLHAIMPTCFCSCTVPLWRAQATACAACHVWHARKFYKKKQWTAGTAQQQHQVTTLSTAAAAAAAACKFASFPAIFTCQHSFLS